jgi:ribosome-binding protein aMBF1 (putative translation factor)
MDRHSITMTIDGVEYVALPADEYRRLRGEAPSAQEDGVAWARAELGRTLRRAREEAELSQTALAKRLKKSQTLVARAELGEIQVSERYVKTVLKACRLPADWPAKKTEERTATRKRAKR